MEEYQKLLIVFWAKYLFAFLILISWIYLLTQKKDKQIEIIVFAAISLPLIYVTAKISSLFFHNPRPFIIDNFIPLIPHANDNWFPSDHTLISSAFAMMIFVFNKKIWVLLWILAILVWISRVLAWVHHWVDIIWSIIISIIITLLFEKFAYKKLIAKIR